MFESSWPHLPFGDTIATAIIANGSIDEDFLKDELKGYTTLIAVDGGLNCCSALGLTPDYIVGDFDSAHQEAAHLFKEVPTKRYSPEKDQTDLELALAFATPSKQNPVGVFGALGARQDHTLTNLILLSRYPDHTTYFTKQESIFAICQSRSICCRAGQVISLLPVATPAVGVTTQGLKWEIRGKTLDNYFFSLSNQSLGSSFQISLQEGSLLCFVNRG